TTVVPGITEGSMAETTMATEITTRSITSMEGRMAFTTSTPTTHIHTAGSTATIRRRRTRRRRTGITAPVTLRTTHTWEAARSRGYGCRLPNVRRSRRPSTSLDMWRHVWLGGVLRDAAVNALIGGRPSA